MLALPLVFDLYYLPTSIYTIIAICNNERNALILRKRKHYTVYCRQHNEMKHYDSIIIERSLDRLFDLNHISAQACKAGALKGLHPGVFKLRHSMKHRLIIIRAKRCPIYPNYWAARYPNILLFRQRGT